jgi:3'-5' exoribonuclease
MIKDLFDGKRVEDEKFLVVTSVKGVTNAGQAYLNVVLQDCSGQIDAKVWSIEDEDIPLFTAGNIIVLDGDVIKYKEKLQLKIDNASLVDAQYEDLTIYVPTSEFSLNELQSKFKILHDKIKDDEYRAVLDDIYKRHLEDLYIYPAAVRNHHAFSRGLVTHSISVAEICDYLCDHYPTLNRDLLLTGALLHDIGKIVEFSSPLIPKYTTEGRLVGHIAIGYCEVSNTCKALKIDEEKRVLLEHLVLSHHGHLEFGSPVLPMTREAVLLSIADDLDAKENFMEKTLDDTVIGDFTQHLFQLDDRCLYKPKK